MSEIQLDIPNIVVLVNNDPDYRKVIVKPDSNFNVNINVPRLVSRVSGSFIQFAETALTSSYALTANRLIDSGTLQLGYISASSMWISESVYVGGMIYGTASQAVTASYALNAAGSGFPFSGSAIITGSLLVVNPNGSVGTITSSLLGTASIAENITVIFAGTYETGSDNPIVPTPSGGLIYVTNADFAISASYAQLAKTASSVHYNNVTNKPTLISSSTQINTGSFTGSFAGAFTGNLTGTSSWAVSASFVTYANVTNKPTLVSSSTQIDYTQIQNKPTSIATASYVEYTNVVNKPTLVSASSQITATQITGIGAYATTASNTFTGIQTVSDTTNSTNFTNGALIVQGGVGITKNVNISGSLRVSGLLTAVSMSTQYVTSSQYNVGVSRITLNDDDNVRFAGMSIYDSGSSSPTTASILWDSLNHKFIYENLSGSTYNSAMFIAGPRNFGTLGNEVGLTNHRIPVSHGDDHIDSRVESSSIRVDFPSRLTHIEAGLQVTGAISTNTGFTGSLLGTSSNAVSSSHALTASFALNGGGGTGAGFPYSGSAIITGSLIVSSSGIQTIGAGFTGSLLGTSSWAQSAVTASYISGGLDIRNGLIITGSTVITGSLEVTGSLSTTRGITGSLLGTSSVANTSISSSYALTASYALGMSGSIQTATSASYALTASYALNAGSGGGSGAGFPFSGSAVITGSLLVSGSGLRVTGSTDIVGALTATTKSFLIDHKKLPGRKLVYGVLEGAEHAVYTRGRLKGNNVIKLPEEWEWLVDNNTITVQLTPIGSHQKLYVKSIDGLYITIEAGGFITQEINCYYLVHATRKDVDPLQTVV
jgi:hypothetical protein